MYRFKLKKQRRQTRAHELITIVPVWRAKIMLSRLIRRAARGETILIRTRDGATARLIALAQTAHGRKLIGAMEGEFEVPEDFDPPLAGESLNGFYERRPFSNKPKDMLEELLSSCTYQNSCLEAEDIQWLHSPSVGKEI